MEFDRATLQLRITAVGYHAFAMALVGASQMLTLDPDRYLEMETLARGAIRQHMGQGFTGIGFFTAAHRAAVRHLSQCFPDAAPIFLEFASDELFTLILEELGLLSPTLH